MHYKNNRLFAVGNSAGGLHFVSFQTSALKMALVLGNEVLVNVKRPSVAELDCLAHFFSREPLLKVSHRDTLYIVTTEPTIAYDPRPKNRAFYALNYLAKYARREPSDVSFPQFAKLCRLSANFKQTLPDTQRWESWWKPCVELLACIYAYPVSLGEAKWFGKVSKRQVDVGREEKDSMECEVLYTKQQLGVAYNCDAADSVNYVSPMILSKGAFYEGIIDTSGVKCSRWTMLYVDDDHWQRYGMSYYLLPHGSFCNVEALTRYDNFNVSDKHRKIYSDIQKLSYLLRK